MRIRLQALVLSTCLAWTAAAFAQDSKIAAEALFDEGRALMNEGKYAEACERFARSDELDPAPGTLLNLAGCYEKLGRTASAWATYRRAGALARARGQGEREKLASERAAAIEPELARVKIDVPDEARIEGLVIRRGDTEVERATFGVSVPVDPGSIVIEASAPGRRPWTTTLSVTPKSAQTVAIPVLQLEDAASESVDGEPPPLVTTESIPATADSDPDPGSSQRMLGYIVGGVGIVGLAVGTGFALSARSQNEDSKSFCRTDDPNRCSAEGVALRDDARSAGTIATIAFGVGLAAIAGGTVLVVTAPSAGHGATLSLGGKF
jgi:serine/threonine-protein kinase